MGRFARKLVGYACIGCGYQTVKRTVKSNSIIGGGFYAGLAGLFLTGAYRFLQDHAIVERLEQLLSQEDPNLASRIKGLLCKKVPSLEKRIQPANDDLYSIQELKRQVMKERGYIK